jgi:replication factor C subunit 3/5|uniref:AAA+ ATPase domain-containing protein n=1 Tax=viral metagenome TaxID=1070528 RepID=A0A6C0DX36_9ZZZZ
MTSANAAKNNIPWTEKYRPSHFDDIVLDPVNRKLFQKILETRYFPNLLFYGPPGTGKTTTILNLIHSYQSNNHEISRGTIIHLNASDERGIDVIRNQIYQFVKSKNLFERGLKFVILDEVDSMTKNAQQALKYLLQQSSQNVRFCLICNYISRIEESLKNEFISIRFNQLPNGEIKTFLKEISNKENLEITDSAIDTIQHIYNSDIRSMINFIQLHERDALSDRNIITDEVYKEIYRHLTEQKCVESFLRYIHEISIQYNTDKVNLLNNYFNYIIRKMPEVVGSPLLNLAENVIHSTPYADVDDILTFLFYNYT